MDVIINENETHIPIELSKWGDLLGWVETDCPKVGNMTPVAIKSGDFDRVFSDSWRICSTRYGYSSSFSEDLGWADAPNAQIYGPEICDFPEYGIVPILEPWQQPVQRTREHVN